MSGSNNVAYKPVSQNTRPTSTVTAWWKPNTCYAICHGLNDKWRPWGLKSTAQWQQHKVTDVVMRIQVYIGITYMRNTYRIGRTCAY
jgi:hypothetical protein